MRAPSESEIQQMQDSNLPKGWLLPAEQRALEKLASWHAPGGQVTNIIEIGSLYGLSTTLLCLAMRKDDRSGIVISIDPHQGWFSNIAEFWYNMRDFKNVLPIITTSDQASLILAWMPCHLIFIDGNHEFEQARRDIANYQDFLVKGGALAMHDCEPTSGLPGPRRAMGEMIDQVAGWSRIQRVEGLAWATKE